MGCGSDAERKSCTSPKLEEITHKTSITKIELILGSNGQIENVLGIGVS